MFEGLTIMGRLEMFHPLLLICVFHLGVVSAYGYFKGGTISWHANTSHPNRIKIEFRLHFGLDYDVYTHENCSRQAIADGSSLRTGGIFYINSGAKRIYAEYVCTDMDERNNWATGIYNWEYVMPRGQTTAEINYEECCWIDSVNNKGKSVTNGRGWNLVSLINTDHGEGTVNSPPLPKILPKYSLMEGCSYTLPIPHSDANGDDVICRWTNESKGECNSDDRDICGEIFYDENEEHKVAYLNETSCTLQFTSSLPSGIYAIPVVLEDFSPNNPETPISKTPVQFLVEVFKNPGPCRLPTLDVPKDICNTLVVGQEFNMEIKATATSPEYRITDIKVLGLASGMDGLNPVPVTTVVTNAEYSATFRFIPSDQHIGKHSFCVLAVEEDRLWSRQPCFTLDVIEQGNEPELTVLPELSVPAQDSTNASDLITEWRIRFSHEIRKANRSAFVRVLDPHGTVIYQTDTSGPGVKVEGDTMSFPHSDNVFLDFQTEYEIFLEEGAAESTDKCSVRSSESRWRVTTRGGYPGDRKSKADCNTTDMIIYLPKITLGTIDPRTMHLYDPQCTGEDHNATHYSISTSYGTCGTSFMRNDTEFIFSNVVYIPDVPYEPGSEITRHPHQEILAVCYVPAQFIRSLSFDPDVRIVRRKIEGRVERENAPMTSLKMYQDEKYQQAVSLGEYPVDVPFGTRMYFEGAAACYDQGCRAVFDSCWATASENPFDTPRHDLIDSGCPTDGNVIMHPSRQPLKARFSVDSFAFLGRRIQDRVHVHCNIAVCNANDDQSICSLGCRSPIAKREATYRFIDWLIKRDVISSAASAPGPVILQ